jgi:drug/metabolite transporter (DMT)-like permease
MKQRYFFYLVMIFQSFIAAGTFLIVKIALREIPPLDIALLRFGLASAVLIFILQTTRKPVPILPNDWKKILWLAILAVPLNQTGFLVGMKFTTPSHAALLYATTPIFVLVLSAHSAHEKISLRKLIGIILAFFGVLSVLLEKGLLFETDFLLGDFLVWLAVLAWAGYTVYAKNLLPTYGAVALTTYALTLGTILFLPIGLWSIRDLAWSTISISAWVSVLYLGLITSVVAYLIWYWALKRVEPSKVAIFSNLQPILTTGMAWLFLSEKITVTFIVGGIITIGGVILTQRG